MSIALDYTSRIDPAALKAAGVSDVLRYLCYAPVGNWKTIKPVEYTELLNAGIGVTLNWEYRETDWNNGFSVGRQHGIEAGAQAKALGYPAGCTIFGSADYDMPWTDWRARGQYYMLGFGEAIQAAGYQPGVYGPWDVLENVYAADQSWKLWQAGMSKSYSGGRNAVRHSKASIRQIKHFTVGGTDTDMNEILIPEWGQARRIQKGFPVGQPFIAYTEATPNTPEQLYLCDGMESRPISHSDASTLRAMEKQGLLKFGENGPGHSSVEFPYKGWSEAMGILKTSSPITASLLPEDRDLLNRAVNALETARPLSSEDLTTMGKLYEVLNTISGYLK